jgi:hypothetical protein
VRPRPQAALLLAAIQTRRAALAQDSRQQTPAAPEALAQVVVALVALVAQTQSMALRAPRLAAAEAEAERMPAVAPARLGV